MTFNKQLTIQAGSSKLFPQTKTWLSVLFKVSNALNNAHRPSAFILLYLTDSCLRWVFDNISASARKMQPSSSIRLFPRSSVSKRVSVLRKTLKYFAPSRVIRLYQLKVYKFFRWNFSNKKVRLIRPIEIKKSYATKNKTRMTKRYLSY